MYQAIKKGEIKLKKKKKFREKKGRERSELKPGFDQVRNYLEFFGNTRYRSKIRIRNRYRI